MKIEVKDLMDDNEMLSHVFLGCMSKEEVIKVKDKYVGTEGNETDWKEESVKIPVKMTIGGIPVNPKNFFDSWKNQMSDIITGKAKELFKEKMGSEKMREMQGKLNEYEQILEAWEDDINWEVENPLIESNN